jgi:hypothetical protein
LHWLYSVLGSTLLLLLLLLLLCIIVHEQVW